MKEITVFWFRRDLRLADNAGLYHALKRGKNVQAIFIFDEDILSKLNDPKDARVTFIHDTLTDLNLQLMDLGSHLTVLYGKPLEVWKKLLKQHDISGVYTNRDYEPYALKRDQEVEDLLKSNEIEFHTFKDHVIFEKHEVLKKDDTPYVVFTPYSRVWKAKLASKMVKEGKKTFSFYLQSYPTEKYFSNFAKAKTKSKIPTLKHMGFERSEVEIFSKEVPRSVIKKYTEQRNFPALSGTSKLGVHFRHGTISIRQKARMAQTLNETYLNELIWRDFYSSILSHFPHVVTGPFREKYKWIEWRNDKEDFQKWCDGQTGYPLVDAGMRELNTTGFMHNRVRMVVASFLTKHLLIDWSWGEAYFAEKLLDFDLASNNGGWQWAAGCGTDAAPYFRIFNPESQLKKFDSKLIYVKKWVPEYGTDEYVEPMVEHKFARERCLATYKTALDRN